MSRSAGILTPSLVARAGMRIQRLRELPLRGEILVKVGQSVNASDIIAHAERPGDLTVLRLPETLGLLVNEVIENLQVKIGDEIKVGTLLCDHRGLFGLLRSRFVSPIEGRVEFISKESGHMGVRAASQRINLNAYISGVVKSVEASRRVVIETEATFVQGIFGIGGERSGVLTQISGRDRVDLSSLPRDLSGMIIFGGSLPTSEVLRDAAARGAVGMIVGAIDDAALRGYLGYELGLALTGDEDISMSVIVTEGFGKLEMGQRVFALLSNCNGMQASINGATQVRAGAIRPEIIIAREGQKETTSEKTGVLQVGIQIRFIRGDHFGMNAEICELPIRPEELVTGAHARVLRAKLPSGEIVTVPRSNVEVLV